MKREAVLHIPMSQYAHGVDESRFVFRLRTGKNDIKRCFLYFGDTACRQTPIVFYEKEMTIVATDELFDYYEVEFESQINRLYYYFLISDGIEEIFYYSDFFREELVDDRSEYYKLPFNRREDIAEIPKWVKEAVIYNIFPDSFASDKEFISGKESQVKFGNLITRGKLGGTITGIEKNVDYLKDLGITCIYINPLFVAGEYHKYDTIDYYNVDPCLGTNDDMKHMVSVLHNSGIKVIIDGVFNHCGWQFFAFEDVVKNGEDSIYKDWFYGLSFPVVRPNNGDEIPGYDCFAYERLMPKLNTSNPEVMEYLINAGTFWIKEFDIDGWRLDVASEVDDNFWREFRKATKAVKSDCFIIGEVWESAQHWLDGSQFDSTMNYDLRKHCKYFFADEVLSASEFDGRITNMRMRYKKNLIWGQLNILDSHDVSRFYSVCKLNIEKWTLAILFQIFFVGIPSIFYGNEQMIEGTEESDYRSAMKWDKENPLYNFYKKAISIRKKYLAVTMGDFRTIRAKEDRVYVFERYNSEENIRIILNASDKKETLYDIDMGNKVIWHRELEETVIGGYGFAILEMPKR